MNTYTLLLEGLLILVIAIFIRHSLYRARHHLHMFQQVGYKTNEYRTWLNNNFYDKGITAEHILFNIVILSMLYLFIEWVTLSAGTLIIITFSIFWFLGVSRYREEKEKKPLVFTSRMKRLTTVLGIILFVSWYYLIRLSYSGLALHNFADPFMSTDPYLLSFSLVVIDMLVPFFLYFSAWLMKPVETFIQNGFKRKARKKLASLPHLKVVAITGSYGKTSTKFVIDTFLKERIRVCVTPGSYNTPMGICKVINNDLSAQHQVLILEMGARYEGNIQELCKIARPDISIITNVGISHLETFGSQKAVAREKSTLARELKPGGTLILNSDDPLVKEMGTLRDDVKVVYAGSEGSVRADDIKVGPSGTSFTMQWMSDDGKPEQQEKIETQLLGAHNIQNMLLAGAVAREFGIRMKTIALAASGMKPVEHRLELKRQNGLIIIDDAFNSNPVGAKNAVDILSSFESGRRIIITPGMIELGDRESEENEKFGEHIARSAIDLIILVGEEQTQPIRRGIQKSVNGPEVNVKVVNSLFEANDIVMDYAKPGDIVLYENDLPDTYSSVS
ncbi:MAG: UDP-N-acetylmuramoyl-tripeptide--D-alanyl-D-alanine ligase [Balneolaceae bacterium]